MDVQLLQNLFLFHRDLSDSYWFIVFENLAEMTRCFEKDFRAITLRSIICSRTSG